MKYIINIGLLSFSFIISAVQAPAPVYRNVQNVEPIWNVVLLHDIQFAHDPHAVDEEPVQKHPGRRGDKYKKPVLTQQQQYCKNNNCANRPKHQFTRRMRKR